jgi:hypothetical protein
VTSTRALTSATYEYVLRLAEEGTALALETDESLVNGLNVAGGRVVHDTVRQSLERSGRRSGEGSRASAPVVETKLGDPAVAGRQSADRLTSGGRFVPDDDFRPRQQ